MKQKSTQRIVALGVLALGLLAHAKTGHAAAVPYQMGEATQITLSGQVENTVNITVTPPDLGTFSATGTVGGAADTATGVILPTAANSYTSDTGSGPYTANSASLVWSPADQPNRGTVVIGGAHATSDVFVAYHSPTVLQIGGAGTGFTIVRITDDLTTPSLYNNVSGTPTITPGRGTTSAGGALTFNIGLSIRTDSTEVGEYQEGVYTGTFDMTMTY